MVVHQLCVFEANQISAKMIIMQGEPRTSPATNGNRATDIDSNRYLVPFHLKIGEKPVFMLTFKMILLD